MYWFSHWNKTIAFTWIRKRKMKYAQKRKARKNRQNKKKRIQNSLTTVS